MSGEVQGAPEGTGGGGEMIAPESRKTALRSNSVSLLGTVGIAVGPQAPTGGINLLPAVMASIVAASASLSFLLGMVAMMFVAYALVVFTRRIASAGQLYSYTGIAIAPAYGVVTGLTWVIGFVSAAAWISIQDGDYLVALFQPIGVVLPWVLMSMIMWVAMVFLTFRSMEVSARTVIAVEAVGVALMLIVAGVVIAHGGYGGHSLNWKPFTLNGQPFSRIMSGVVFAFTSFAGFEAAGSLGEEARRPKWSIPVAIFSALIVSGSIYVFMTWVSTVGYSSVKDFSEQTTPLVTLADQYMGGPMRTIMNIAALISGFGAQLACLAGATRVLYAIGRDGLHGRAQQRFTKLHPRFGTPVVPFALACAVSGIGILAFSGAGPLGSITDISAYGADIGIIVYLLVVIAAIVFCWRYERKIYHLAILAAGILVMGYIVWGSLYPIPQPPLNWAMYSALATFVIVILVLVVFPGVRRRLRRSVLFDRGRLLAESAVSSDTEAAGAALEGGNG